MFSPGGFIPVIYYPIMGNESVPVPPANRITDESDTRITDAGDTRIVD